MQTELRKLATLIRKRGAEEQKQKLVKCAQVLSASTALSLLARKVSPTVSVSE